MPSNNKKAVTSRRRRVTTRRYRGRYLYQTPCKRTSHSELPWAHRERCRDGLEAHARSRSSRPRARANIFASVGRESRHRKPPLRGGRGAWPASANRSISMLRRAAEGLRYAQPRGGRHRAPCEATGGPPARLRTNRRPDGSPAELGAAEATDSSVRSIAISRWRCGRRWRAANGEACRRRRSQQTHLRDCRRRACSRSTPSRGELQLRSLRGTR